MLFEEAAVAPPGEDLLADLDTSFAAGFDHDVAVLLDLGDYDADLAVLDTVDQDAAAAASTAPEPSFPPPPPPQQQQQQQQQQQVLLEQGAVAPARGGYGTPGSAESGRSRSSGDAGSSSSDDGAGKPRSDGEGGQGEAARSGQKRAGSSSRKKAGKGPLSNAEICRRHRERKRKLAEDLKTRNEELLEERELMLHRIATLQQEAYALRAENAVDLSVENELLRMEIRKHRRFLQTITRTVTQDSSTPEEKYRMIHKGLQSGRSQALGMAYCAKAGASAGWVKHNPFHIPSHNIMVSGRVQQLPSNVPFSECKRFNQCLIFEDIPYSMDTYRDVTWTSKILLAGLNDLMRDMTAKDGVDRKVDSILSPEIRNIHEQVGDPGSELFVSRYVEKTKDGSRNHELIMAGSSHRAKLHPHTLGLDYFEEAEVDGIVSVTTTGLQGNELRDVLQVLDGGKQAHELTTKLHFNAYLLLPGRTEDTTTVVHVNSFPVEFFLTKEEGGLSKDDGTMGAIGTEMTYLVSDEGDLHPRVIHGNLHQWHINTNAIKVEQDRRREREAAVHS